MALFSCDTWLRKINSEKVYFTNSYLPQDFEESQASFAKVVYIRNFYLNLRNKH